MHNLYDEAKDNSESEDQESIKTKTLENILKDSENDSKLHELLKREICSFKSHRNLNTEE